MTKPTKWHVRPAKTQITLGIRPVWSKSSRCAQWVAEDPMFLHADSEVWSDWADAKADLSLRWAHSHFVGFVTRQLIYWFFFDWEGESLTLRTNGRYAMDCGRQFTVMQMWKVIHPLGRKKTVNISPQKSPVRSLRTWLLAVEILYNVNWACAR